MQCFPPQTCRASRACALRRQLWFVVLHAAALSGLPALVTTVRAGDAITLAEPLPVLLQRGAAAFASGDYARAAAAFADVEKHYGAEREWREGTLPRRLLPLRGFAELRAGLTGDATESLARFLELFPDDLKQRGFVLYALAIALRQSGRPDEALARFEAYEEENPGTAQAALARFQRAEILFARDRSDEALELLRALAKAAPSETLRTQARLRALQKAVALQRDALAAELLFDSPWSVTTMPEIAVLAFAAMELGDRLMAAGRATEALRAYRLVLPKERLVAAQRERLQELQARFDEIAPTVQAGAGSFWVDFYRARIAQLEAQLRGLEAAEDYNAPLRLRIGQAWLLAGRSHEAWLLFESLALDEDVPAALRQEAHYRWLLAAIELEAWNEALAIARGLVERYPEAEHLPETFHLIARAHLEQRRYAQAAAVLGDILVRFPSHEIAPRARFTRGWVRAMQEDFAGAREDFDAYLARHADGPLAVNAALWRALSFFFERRHAEALAALDALVPSAAGHPLLPEILYRRGMTLYAMRDYEAARAAMEDFTAQYAQHPRYPEALVLLGDILMGAGELDTARTVFARVSPDAPEASTYAVFQTGKILRATGDYDGMAAHFRAYAERTGTPAPSRISEALYWIGWAEEQRGDAAAALPLYLDVLERFGNDPAAGEIGTTLGALERLVSRIRRSATGGEPPDAAPDPRVQPLLARTFDAWLADERAAARTQQRFTWYARLSVFKAERHAARKQPHQEETTLLEIAGVAPLESLDAVALARVGLALQAIGSSEAMRYLHRLLDTFPNSFERAAAYYGLAAIAVEARDFPAALRWLERFENETPTHRLAPRAALLAGTALERAGRFDRAVARFEHLLRLKSARGRPHAEALLGLARCCVAQGEAAKAIAYCQRVYTVYRAYRDLMAEAYLQSAGLFAQRGDLQAAAATYREMLAAGDVGDAAQRETASRELEAILARLPPPPEPAEQPEDAA